MARAMLSCSVYIGLHMVTSQLCSLDSPLVPFLSVKPALSVLVITRAHLGFYRALSVSETMDSRGRTVCSGQSLIWISISFYFMISWELELFVAQCIGLLSFSPGHPLSQTVAGGVCVTLPESIMEELTTAGSVVLSPWLLGSKLGVWKSQ